eukprot:scaffold412_cov388-Prasinococcus_capsulatus_cf.AAC.47
MFVVSTVIPSSDSLLNLPGTSTRAGPRAGKAGGAAARAATAQQRYLVTSPPPTLACTNTVTLCTYWNFTNLSGKTAPRPASESDRLISWAGKVSSASAKSIDSLFTNSFTALGAVPSAGPWIWMLCSLTIWLNGIEMSSCSSASDSRYTSAFSRRPTGGRDTAAAPFAGRPALRACSARTGLQGVRPRLGVRLVQAVHRVPVYELQEIYRLRPAPAQPRQTPAIHPSSAVAPPRRRRIGGELFGDDPGGGACVRTYMAAECSPLRLAPPPPPAVHQPARRKCRPRLVLRGLLCALVSSGATHEVTGAVSAGDGEEGGPLTNFKLKTTTTRTTMMIPTMLLARSCARRPGATCLRAHDHVALPALPP